MINVNIWISTTRLFNKPIKNRFFGPLLASEDKGENVGHVNFTVEIDERSRGGFEFIETHALGLGAKKTLRAVPTLVTMSPYPSEVVFSHVKPTLVRSDVVSHSFWPEDKPTKFELFKGAKAKFNTHDSDMIGEDSLTPMEIKHRTNALAELDKEKSRNLDLYVEISDLDISLEKRMLSELELSKLYAEKEQLLETQQRLTMAHKKQLDDLQLQLSYSAPSIQKIESQIIPIERTLNYLTKLQNPESRTKIQMTELQGKLGKLRDEKDAVISSQDELGEVISQSKVTFEEGMRHLETNLHKVGSAIKYHEDAVVILDAQINGRDEHDLEALKGEAHRRKDYTARKEQYIKSRDFTEGRQPDYSLTLPTAESGLTYYLDEVSILKGMQEERIQNYSFLFNNCASSAKRCLLKGIDEELKAKLKEAGLGDKFFVINKIETTKSLRDWAKKLERTLNELNFPPLSPSITQGHSIS